MEMDQVKDTKTSATDITDTFERVRTKEQVEEIEQINSEKLYEQDTIEETTPGRYIWLVCAAVAGVDGLLFGVDTGILNGVLVTIGDDLGRILSSSDKELLTSILSAGAFITACLSGYIADKFGRKRVMLISTITFFLGALLQAVSFSFVQMVIGRFIVGLGVGAASMIAPAYIAELAPRRYRGRLVVIDVICITGGQLVAYCIDLIFQNVNHGWRVMVGIAGIPAIILFFLLPILPESPRHLIRIGRINEAKEVIRKTFPNGSIEQLDTKMQLMVQANALAIQTKMGYFELLREIYFKPANFRALIVACGLMVCQQISGFNTLMYYSSTIFKSIGFSNAIAIGVTVAGTNFLFTCISLKYIDSIGRRNILVWSMWGMPIGLILAAIGYHYIPKDLTGAIFIAENQGVPWGAKLMLFAMMFFVAAYATGLGNVPWQSTEFFPLTIRGEATTMMTACNWGPNLLVSSTFLSLMNAITPPGAFGLYAILNFFSWIAVILFFPEAAGLPLEEVPRLFEHGFGVSYSLKLRKERKDKKFQKEENENQDTKV